jgi:hypothetical protein
MSKLFKFKKWLTIEDAAKYLSLRLNEPLSVSDILRLSLDGHLTLSVRFVNPVYAKRGRLIPIEDAKFSVAPALFGSGTVRLYDGPQIYEGGKVTKILSLEEGIFELEDIYRLSMMGAEILDIENQYQQLTDRCEVTSINLDGVILRGNDDYFFQLLEFYDSDLLRQNKVKKGDEKMGLEAFFASREPLEKQLYPAGGLPPEDSSFVLVMDDLKLFEESIENSRPEVGGALSQREETTYLNIIGALLDFMAGRHPNGEKHPSFKNEAKLIETIESFYKGYAGLSRSNLQKKFSAAKRSINSV